MAGSTHSGELNMDQQPKPRFSWATVLGVGIAAATLMYAITSHSTDNNTAMEGRVAATETGIKSVKDDAVLDRREFQRRLDTIDQRTIDIYKVLLDMQQHQAEQRK